MEILDYRDDAGCEMADSVDWNLGLVLEVVAE
jgi:hypothetical protein